MKNIPFMSVLTAGAVAFSACNQGAQQVKRAAPQDDFYMYANAQWMSQNPLPDDKPRLGTFDVLSEENLDRLKLLMEEAANAGAEAGTPAQKIGDLYKLGMDTARRNADGCKPLKPAFAYIDNCRNSKDVAFVTAILHGVGVHPFFAFGSEVDPDNSSAHISCVFQSGLGLPDRDYYFDEGERPDEIRAGYVAYLTKLLELVGEANANERAKQVFALEKALAHNMNTRVENRDPRAITNKRTYAQMLEQVPGFDWKKYMSHFEDITIDTINIAQPKYFAVMGGVIGATDLQTVKDYFKCRLTNAYAPYLSEDFGTASFEFHGKLLSGSLAQRPLWKRVVDGVDGALGEELGKLFVAKYFPEAAKARISTLIEHLRGAFAQRIDNLEWMGSETKAKAKEKLEAITVKVGYPDKWRDYSELNIDPERSFAANIMVVELFEFKRDLLKIGKPVDRSEWHMTPQTVNAYYSPQTNEIVFPAGILQPPFFYADGDDATNYGGIGVVIGHEMTHGFDDQGSQFDKNGNLRDWWTAADRESFKAKTKFMEDHFNELVAVGQEKCNGKLTLGENIADNGGLNISYQALRNALTGAADPMTEGQTVDERFLLSYAHIWAANVREEFVQKQIKTDPHSPATLRVNGQMMLLDLYYKTFGVAEGSPMFKAPEARLSVW